MGLMNRLANCHNKYQGSYTKVLTVCSAGLLRSATMAYVLTREPYNCNVRNCGVDSDFALIPIDEVLVEWSDYIFCAESWQKEEILKLCKLWNLMVDESKFFVMDLPDNFAYRDIRLIAAIEKKLKEIGFATEAERGLK